MLIGLSGVAIDVIAYAILTELFDVNVFLANVISVSLGITNNFFLNRQFNFKKKDSVVKRFVFFYSIGLLGLLLSEVLLFAFIERLGLDSAISKILTLPFVLIFQYSFNKRFSFGDINIIDRFFAQHWKSIIIYSVFYLLFMVQNTYFGFSDEYDNILGGWLMSNHGEIIYRDFFSHHMPLPYFISAIITFFTENNLNLFRFSFITLCFVWVLLIARNLRQIVGQQLSLLFIGIVALAQYLTWAHMILAETLIAYATVHAITLFILRSESNRPISRREIILISLLCAIPFLSALSYAFLSLALYVFFGFIYFRKNMASGKKINFLRILKDILIVSVPYILLGIWFIVTNSTRQFIDQAYNFNKQYYSQFVNDVAPTFQQTLSNNTTDLINNITVILNVDNNSAGILAVLSFVALSLYLLTLIMQKRWLIAGFILTIFVTIALRDNVILRIFADGNNRLSGVYALFILMICILMLGQASRLRLKDPGFFILQITAMQVSVLLLSLVFVKSIGVTVNIERSQRHAVETGLQLYEDGGHIPRVINFVANEPTDYYWVGPFDFYSQLYVNAQRSSDYTFILPWQGICESCKQDILSDFTSQKPTVIYWQHDVKIFREDMNIDNYNKDIQKILDHDYYTYKNDKYLRNFYFLSSQKSEIDKKLSDNNLFFNE